MLFMGGIITSCIDNPEPQGVLAMREAHAEYLRALAKLTEANKAVVDAEAAFQQAQAAVQQAIARNKNANAEAKEIANAVAKAAADASIDSILDAMKITQANNAADLADAQAALARAQKDLEDALNAIEIESLGLSEKERVAIDSIRSQYNYWAGELKDALNDIKTADQNKFNWLVKALEDAALDGAEMAYYVDSIETLIDLKELELAFAESDADFWQGILYDMNFDYLAEAQEFENAARELDEDITVLLRDSVLFEQEFGFARDEAYRQADTVYNDAVKAPTAEFEAFEEELADALYMDVATLRAFLSVTFNPLSPIYNPTLNWAKAPKAGYSFIAPEMVYGKVTKKYVIPEHEAGDVIDLFVDSLNALAAKIEASGLDKHFEINGDDVLELEAYASDSAKYAKVVDTIWYGSQATSELLKQPTGIWSLYEDFGRSLLFNLNEKGIEADSVTLKAYADSMKSEYAKTLAILKAGKPGEAGTRLAKWYKTVTSASANIDKYVKQVNGYQNAYNNVDEKNKVYKVTDADKGLAEEKEPVLLVNYYAQPRKVSIDANDAKNVTFTNLPDNPIYTTDPDVLLTMTPTHADSVAVFDAIVNAFKEVAKFDSTKVPYLRFIQTKDGGATYIIDSVRADKMVFSGIQIKKTNTYLETAGIKRAATYDNKGIKDPETPAPDPQDYLDAFGNVVMLFNHYFNDNTILLPTPLYTAKNQGQKKADAGVETYVTWVKDLFDANVEVPNADPLKATMYKKLGYYSIADQANFKKYAAMTEEGKKFKEWYDASAKYFGNDKFAGVAEKIFFDYETFTDPEWVVVFKSIPEYTSDKGKVKSLDLRGLVNNSSTSYQYQFVKGTIKNNLAVYDGTYTADEYLAEPENCVMAASSLVFELLNAEYLYYLSTHTESINAMWTALGDVLKQAMKDMDAVYKSAAGNQAQYNHIAELYNEALYIYREAIGDAADEWEDATDAADEAYLEAYEEIMHPILHELANVRAEQDHLNDLAAALRGAYATQYGAADADALKAYILGKYNAAISSCGDLARDIEKLEQELDKLEAAIERFASDPTAAYNPDAPAYNPGDWKKGTIIFTDEALEELAAEIDFINAILDGFAEDDLAEIEYWYSYWAAVYDAAIQWVNEKGE